MLTEVSLRSTGVACMVRVVCTCALDEPGCSQTPDARESAPPRYPYAIWDVWLCVWHARAAERDAY